MAIYDLLKSFLNKKNEITKTAPRKTYSTSKEAADEALKKIFGKH